MKVWHKSRRGSLSEAHNPATKLKEEVKRKKEEAMKLQVKERKKKDGLKFTDRNAIIIAKTMPVTTVPVAARALSVVAIQSGRRKSGTSTPVKMW